MGRARQVYNVLVVVQNWRWLPQAENGSETYTMAWSEFRKKSTWYTPPAFVFAFFSNEKFHNGMDTFFTESQHGVRHTQDSEKKGKIT
jgi:hypothetical protein